MSNNKLYKSFFGLLVCLVLARTLGAQVPTELTTVSTVRALTPEQAGLQLPVRVRGVVTVHSGWKSSFFFQDGGAGISVDRLTDDPPVEAGQEVEIRGVTGAGLFAPVILATSVRVLGAGKLQPPRKFDYRELISGQEDSQWIEVRGIVRSASVKPAWGRMVLFLTIDIGRGNLIVVRVHDFAPGGFADLVGAEVSARGVCGTDFNDKRQLVGLRLFAENLTDLRVEKPAPADPFAGATRPVGSLLQFHSEPSPEAISRVKVRGTLTYQEPGRGLYIQSGEDGLFAHREQPVTEQLGTELEVIGYPEATAYSPTLLDASIRSTGRNVPVAAKSVRASDLLVQKDGFLSAPYDSVLVKVRGRLIQQLVSTHEDTLLLQDQDAFLSVLLRYADGGPHVFYQTGTLLEVTGVCVARVDEHRDVQSFEVLARSPADIVVAERAPWGTRAHLLWAVLLLGVLAIATSGGLTIIYRGQRLRQIGKSNVALTNEIMARERVQQELHRKTDQLSLLNAHLDRVSSEELRRSDVRRITALESAQLGDWQIDLQTGVASGSSLHYQIFGYSEQLTAWSFAIFLQHVWQEDRERVAKIFAGSLEKLGKWDFECRIVWPDQSIHWIWACGAPYVDPLGRITHVMGTVADITARKQTEAAQAHSQRLESLGTLAGGIAHDFNNILLAITGNAKLAIADLAQEHPAQESLREIAKASARATDLVRSILTFSRPGEVTRQNIDLRPVVEEALQLVRATVPATIEFHTAFAAELPAVLAASVQIHQIVVNLATNAVHAIGARSGGLVEIRMDTESLAANEAGLTPGLPEGTYVRLSVRDNGCGMDRTTQERIFDPFFTTKGVGEGTGLGLAVVHGIMKSHGGGVAVGSVQDEGTTFRLYFPSAGVITPPKLVPSFELQRDRTEHVLYVDDEEALVILVTRTLQRLGYKVTGSTDPLEAVELFRANSQAYDVVVTDLSMPGLSGFDLSRRLLAIRPNTPIVLTTGCVRPEDRERAIQMGLRDVVLKPDSVEQLSHSLDVIFQRDRPCVER